MAQIVYAGVVIDRVHPALDKIFHYGIPDDIDVNDLLGRRVSVPFGAGNKFIDAYVMTLDDTIDLPKDKIKNINKLLDKVPVVLTELIPLIFWIRDKYHCLIIEAVRLFIPPGLRRNIGHKYERIAFLNVEEKIEEKIDLLRRRSVYMAEILRILDEEDGIEIGELADMAGGAPLSSFNNLVKRGYIRLERQEVYRDPWDDSSEETETEIKLTYKQREAIDVMSRDFEEIGQVFLLHGITGSGKTEIYINVVKNALLNNKRAIILVPEISLTPQTVRLFKARFGDKVAILHSRLSIGERYDEWKKIYDGRVDIVVGARSAVFAPIKDIGAIIIDEAHDDSYKSESRPRYHTLEFAKERLRLNGGILVLGTATPDISDYKKALNGDYKIIELDSRIGDKALPHVEVVDMREELRLGNRTIFSNALFQALKTSLSKGEQAIILLNRRGYAQFVSCRSCGHVIECESCDISLTYHSKGNILKCHYCGDIKVYPDKCPNCKSPHIKHFGIGTQRVEEEIKKLLPFSKIIRMDMDTTSRKGAHERILDSFRRGEYNILLGTQMIAKGLDYPNVTVVGVLAADSSLNLPDYRSSEKTFQLITQVAGRAGRGEKSGNVIVQTYQPEHFSINYAKTHDYIGFFNEERVIRERFLYPPYSHIIRILLRGEKEDNIIRLSKESKDWFDQKINDDIIMKKGLINLASYPAPLEKIKNKYRWHILIRINNEDIYKNKYHELISEYLKVNINQSRNIVIDFYPISLL